MRHRPAYETAGTSPNLAGVADSIADHLWGHASPPIASRYRHFDVPPLAKAVEAVPLPVK